MLRHFPMRIFGQEIRRVFDNECSVQDEFGDILFTIGIFAHFLDSACGNEDALTLGNLFVLCHRNAKTGFLSDILCNRNVVNCYGRSRHECGDVRGLIAIDGNIPITRGKSMCHSRLIESSFAIGQSKRANSIRAWDGFPRDPFIRMTCHCMQDRLMSRKLKDRIIIARDL